MKNYKRMLWCLSGCFLLACGKQTEKDAQTSNAVQEGIEMLKRLPEIEKEMASVNDALSAQRISGDFKGSIDGQAFNFSEWKASESYANFFDHKATFYLALDEENNEYISITVRGDAIYTGKELSGLAPTMVPFEMDKEAVMAQFEKGFVYVKYTNETLEEEFSTARGAVILKKMSENELYIEWKGEAFLGEWQKMKTVPFEASIAIDYNFLKDHRNK